jgi:peptide/nickel transport system ATP-binding protein/peptide/nickel transport system permease protein
LFRRWLQALRSPVGAVSFAMVALIVLLAIVAPEIWSHAADRFDIAAAQQGSSHEHLLGTDALGRDILDRLLVATRLSVSLAALATAIGAAIGIPIGALPVIAGPRLGRLVAGFINLTVAFPALLLAIFVAGIVGIGAKGAVIGLGCAVAPYFARLSQTLSASVAGSDYVAAARVLGVGRTRLVTRHVLPNIAEPLLLTITISMGEALLALAGLSFLGLGVQPPDYDWGRMLNEGLGRIYVTPIVALAPAVAIVFAAVAFNLFGEALAKAAGGRTAPGRRSSPAPEDVLADRRTAALAAGDAGDLVLDCEGLSVSFPGGSVPVRDISIALEPGEIVGIVGESGSGKSLTAMAIADLLPGQGRMTARRMRLFGQDPRALDAAARRKLLGSSLAIVYQDPMSSLNPALRVGTQLAEVSEVHQGLSRSQARERSVDRLRLVRVNKPERRIRQYPYELSGGMRQRAVLGQGLMIEPRLIIADEPTTALDVTVQQQILRLLDKASKSAGAAAIFISHDIAVVSQLCNRVLVMYAGRIVEELDIDALMERPAHPYTAALVASVPTMETERDQRLATIPGRAPGPFDHSPGCPFASRCPLVTERCRVERPELEPLATGHRVACWHPLGAGEQASALGEAPSTRDVA